VRALRPFFEEWYPRLVRYLRAKLGDADQAEDIAQEAFVRLLDARPRDPASWLFRVATNLATDHARIAQGRSRHLKFIVGENPSGTDLGPEQPVLRAEEIGQVRRALAALSERDRMLLLLHHDGWRYREIARQLGVAPSSVGSLLTRAERRFVKSLHSLSDGDAKQASV
jgi:RNA polymerase sigma-70 factor, ECF subfamily